MNLSDKVNKTSRRCLKANEKHCLFPKTRLREVVLSGFLVIVHMATGQPYPVTSWPVRNQNRLTDLGSGWQGHTLLNPHQSGALESMTESNGRNWIERDQSQYFQLKEKNTAGPDRVYGESWIGLFGQASADTLIPDFTSLYWMQQFRFRNFWTSWHIRTSTEEQGLSGFTGYSRDIARAGMHLGEFDQALIGYTDDHFHVQFGRDRQMWGAGTGDHLIFSENAASWDHLSAHFQYRRWKLLFFTGFLETVPIGEDLYHRYISGHAVEFSNHRDFVITAGEVTNYFGKDRPFDLSYLNPIPIHVETELNRRENVPYDEGNQSNAVYLLSADWKTPMKTRISATWLFDEFQLDQSDRDEGRPDAMAARYRVAHPIRSGQVDWVVSVLHERVGTHTYQHENGLNNFISRGLPLGSPLGSDYISWEAAIFCVMPFRTTVRISLNQRTGGENNILGHPYTPYSTFEAGAFPSGSHSETQCLCIEGNFSLRPNMEARILYNSIQVERESRITSQSTLLLQVNLYAPFTYFIR